MTQDRLITLSIHTFEKALPIKAMLEREGIYVELNNVNLSAPVVSPGVRIRIKETDLPLALRIIENIEIFKIPDDEKVIGGKILVPTDFSDYSDKAARMAFQMASKLGCELVFLYSFVPPSGLQSVPLSDSYDFQLSDMEASRKVKDDAYQQMEAFAIKMRGLVKSGDVPGVKFDTVVAEGLPEEAIIEYARSNVPQLIVMGTRGADKKEAELIGSVTAEVLDSCRVPAFTVPENADIALLTSLRRVAFFCNLDQEDMLALDYIYRLFPDINLEVTLIHIPGRRERAEHTRLAKNSLLEYCRSHFNGYRFELCDVGLATMLDDMTRIAIDLPFNLICLPNKKRNVFARVFNPSLAHKILFRADIPMMVIPV